MSTKPVLEPSAQAFADATANPPFLFDLGPEKGRETVDEVQSGVIAMPDVEITSPPGCCDHRSSGNFQADRTSPPLRRCRCCSRRW